jgi:hypothetical protein
MKLITEIVDMESVEILTEEKEGRKSTYIIGPFV